MTNKTGPKTETNGEKETIIEDGHVHGPNCNHGHHHHHLKPIVRVGAKVGRNDDCPCGSQKKFKKCCGK